MHTSALETSRHLSFDRRTFLKGATALIAAGLLPESVLALAAPFSFKQGDLEVLVVSDGSLTLPAAILAPDAPAEERKAILTALGVTGDTVQPAASPTLIRSGNDLILFDTGSGGNFQPTAGKLMASLADAGIGPEAITKVIFTHAHPDHCWGTTGADGAFTFPSAAHYVAAPEWDFWTNQGLAAKMPEGMRPMVQNTQKTLGAMKDKVTMFKPGDDIVAGIKAVESFGHTPGHVSFEVPGGEGLLILGDVIIVPAVYFPHPEWAFGFDAISDMAVATRKKMLDRAATDKMKVLGYHWAYPGVGHAEKQGTGYQYVPVG